MNEKDIIGQSPALIPEQVAQASGIEGLKKHTRSDGNFGLAEFYLAADVERLLATQSAQEVTQQAAKAETTEQAVPQGWSITAKQNQEGRFYIVSDGRSMRAITEHSEPTMFRYFSDFAPTTSTVSATAEESRKEADWARAVAFASANQNVSTVSASGALVHVGTLCVVKDNDSSLGYGYDISTNMAGHKLLQTLDGVELYAAQAATDKSED